MLMAGGSGAFGFVIEGGQLETCRVGPDLPEPRSVDIAPDVRRVEYVARYRPPLELTAVETLARLHAGDGPDLGETVITFASEPAALANVTTGERLKLYAAWVDEDGYAKDMAAILELVTPAGAGRHTAARFRNVGALPVVSFR